MFIRLLAPAAAVAVLAFAGSAAAQSSWTHSSGSMTLTLPSNMATHPMGAENAEKGQFVVRRAGSDIGICITSVVVADPPPSQQVWDAVVGTYTGDPEGQARESSVSNGHTYLRHLGLRAYRSQGGWAGYAYWFERINKQSGQKQTAVNAGTMLDYNHRFVAVCTSSTGYLFESGELNSIVNFITSARRP